MRRAVFFNNRQEVIDIVNRLGDAPMRKGSHGFDENRVLKIREAAARQIAKGDNEKNAAIALIGVVLGANRNWEKVVKPNLECLKRRYPSLTFVDLRKIMSEMNWMEFKTFWGHRDKKKYDVLSRLLEQILNYAKDYSNLDDLELARKWVHEFKFEMLHDSHEQYKNFPGSIPNVGIATFQHLRLTFGVDTVKPDQRVKEVLFREFGKKLSDMDAILAVVDIAKITNQKVIMIDQIFVKYGSGHYNVSAS